MVKNLDADDFNAGHILGFSKGTSRVISVIYDLKAELTVSPPEQSAQARKRAAAQLDILAEVERRVNQNG